LVEWQQIFGGEFQSLRQVDEEPKKDQTTVFIFIFIFILFYIYYFIF